jgi:hypothetical protein
MVWHIEESKTILQEIQRLLDLGSANIYESQKPQIFCLMQ